MASLPEDHESATSPAVVGEEEAVVTEAQAGASTSAEFVDPSDPANPTEPLGMTSGIEEWVDVESDERALKIPLIDETKLKTTFAWERYRPETSQLLDKDTSTSFKTTSPSPPSATTPPLPENSSLPSPLDAPSEGADQPPQPGSPIALLSPLNDLVEGFISLREEASINFEEGMSEVGGDGRKAVESGQVDGVVVTGCEKEQEGVDFDFVGESRGSAEVVGEGGETRNADCAVGESVMAECRDKAKGKEVDGDLLQDRRGEVEKRNGVIRMRDGEMHESKKRKPVDSSDDKEDTAIPNVQVSSLVSRKAFMPKVLPRDDRDDDGNQDDGRVKRRKTNDAAPESIVATSKSNSRPAKSPPATAPPGNASASKDRIALSSTTSKDSQKQTAKPGGTTPSSESHTKSLPKPDHPATPTAALTSTPSTSSALISKRKSSPTTRPIPSKHPRAQFSGLPAARNRTIFYPYERIPHATPTHFNNPTPDDDNTTTESSTLTSSSSPAAPTEKECAKCQIKQSLARNRGGKGKELCGECKASYRNSVRPPPTTDQPAPKQVPPPSRSTTTKQPKAPIGPKQPSKSITTPHPTKPPTLPSTTTKQKQSEKPKPTTSVPLTPRGRKSGESVQKQQHSTGERKPETGSSSKAGERSSLHSLAPRAGEGETSLVVKPTVQKSPPSFSASSSSTTPRNGATKKVELRKGVARPKEGAVGGGNDSELEVLSVTRKVEKAVHGNEVVIPKNGTSRKKNGRVKGDESKKSTITTKRKTPIDPTLNHKPTKSKPTPTPHTNSKSPRRDSSTQTPRPKRRRVSYTPDTDDDDGSKDSDVVCVRLTKKSPRRDEFIKGERKTSGKLDAVVKPGFTGDELDAVVRPGFTSRVGAAFRGDLLDGAGEGKMKIESEVKTVGNSSSRSIDVESSSFSASKCLTCRRRKKVCDKALPKCGQCRKGYVRTPGELECAYEKDEDSESERRSKGSLRRGGGRSSMSQPSKKKSTPRERSRSEETDRERDTTTTEAEHVVVLEPDDIEYLPDVDRDSDLDYRPSSPSPDINEGPPRRKTTTAPHPTTNPKKRPNPIHPPSPKPTQTPRSTPTFASSFTWTPTTLKSLHQIRNAHTVDANIASGTRTNWAAVAEEMNARHGVTKEMCKSRYYRTCGDRVRSERGGAGGAKRTEKGGKRSREDNEEEEDVSDGDDDM
ncbi:hypothetical protein HDV00_002265 [Rhizophlyctis rosea]|nr:hypothetical protein HDV00_002265 [Rhizophlyctis rosea]